MVGYMGTAYWTSVSQHVGAEAAEVFIRVEGNDFCAGFQNFTASVINNPIQDYWYSHGDYHIFFSLTVHAQEKITDSHFWIFYGI